MNYELFMGEALAEAELAIERGERPEKARNWLIAIAHNVCRHRFRHARRRPWEVELDVAAARSLREPEETIAADQIRDALEALGHNQRTALEGFGTAFAGPAYGGIIVATALAAGWLARAFPVT